MSLFFPPNMIVFLIVTAIVSVVTIVLCVAFYWHVDYQGQIVRIGNCLKLRSLCYKVLSSELSLPPSFKVCIASE